MLKNHFDELILKDPYSSEILQRNRTSLVNNKNNISYKVIENVPFLINEITFDKLSVDPDKIRTKHSFSWTLKYWESLKLENLIGRPENENELVLLYGSGNIQEKRKIEALGYRVVAIDLNYAYAGVDAVVDGHFLPFQDGQFDHVILFEVLEHLYNPWKAVSEIVRVLKYNGKVTGSVAFLKPFHESYFHFTHWGVKRIFEEHQMELITIYGGQNILNTIPIVGFPKPIKKVLFGWNNFIKNTISYIRGSLWSIKHKKSSRVKDKKFENGIFSFVEFDLVKIAPTILFSFFKKP